MKHNHPDLANAVHYMRKAQEKVETATAYFRSYWNNHVGTGPTVAENQAEEALSGLNADIIRFLEWTTQDKGR